MKRTLEAQVLFALLSGKRLTSLDAVNDFNTPRLAAYIHTIRKKWEINIISQQKCSNCPKGRTIRYVQYFIAPDDLYRIYKELFERRDGQGGISHLLAIAERIKKRVLKRAKEQKSI